MSLRTKPHISLPRRYTWDFRWSCNWPYKRFQFFNRIKCKIEINTFTTHVLTIEKSEIVEARSLIKKSPSDQKGISTQQHTHQLCYWNSSFHLKQPCWTMDNLNTVTDLWALDHLHLNQKMQNLYHQWIQSPVHCHGTLVADNTLGLPKNNGIASFHQNNWKEEFRSLLLKDKIHWGTCEKVHRH